MAADDNQSNLKHGKTTSTGAVSPNGAKKPKDRVPVKPELTEINQYLMCSLCSGYLIDATAIIECQHTFCKSCILKYLETNSYCPICDVQLNKAKPHMSLRSDVIVQRLVYKLVPGLLVSELRKRRDFGVLKCGIDGVEAAESASNSLALEVESASDLSTILSLEDVVSLSIEYFRSDSEDANSKLSHEKQEQPVEVSGNSAISCIQEAKESEDSQTQKANDRRYLQCPAAVSVGLLKKFIRMKYGLSDDYRVDLLYNGDRDNILETDLTLLDVAFIFKWNKDSNEPMNFQYRIFEKGAKPLTSRTATKRSASSMMDEPPPDDDGAAGPQNRPSMTSTSPSSKMPRLSERDNSTSTGANSSGNTGKSSSRSTASTLSSTPPVYEFTEGTDDSDFDTKKGKSRGYHRLERSSQSSKKSPILSSRLQSSSSRSHSTEGKQGKDSSSASSSSFQVERRSASTSTARGRSNSVGGRNDVDSEDDDDESSSSSSDSQEIARPKSSNSPTGTTARLRSAAQHVLKSQMNGSLKFSLSTEKREPLKLSLATKNLERRHHKHRHHKMKHKDKGKHVKVNINLSSQGGNSSSNSNSNQSTGQSHKLSGKEVKHTLGKTHGNAELGGSGGGSKGVDRKGNGNASGGTNSHNNLPAGSVKTATSAHLSAISKSISVSIGGVNMQGNNGTSGNNSQQGKGSSSNKVISPTELLPKNTGIEIQPTTILHSTNTHHQSSSSTGTSNNQSVSARTHPLLPDSVHVPKSVTLIPVNPNAMSGCPNRGNSSGNSQEKSGSSATQTRFNSHTFTHPITNKSLHQITVTEVPPPSKSTSPNNNSGNNGGNGGGNSVSGNSGSVTTGNHCGMGNSSSSSSNSIEKAMSHGGNSKPQFNGPGSMEITKIYCGMKENPAKKLKERKGLDISISVPGMTIKDKSKPNLSSQKLEETLRQKMGSGGVTVNNKIKPNSSGPSGLLNARMPPGITIGPAGINKSGLGNIGANSTSTGSNGGGMSGTNAIKGLGFTLPPHITAHPQLPPGGMKGSGGGGGGHQPSIKSNEGQSKSLGGSQPQNRSFPGKDQSTNMTGNLSHKMKTPGGNGSGGQSTMETLLNGKSSSGGGSKNQINRKHLGEALASMLEMAQRNPGKSPSPPKTSQPPKEKTIQSHLFSGQSNQRESSGSLGSVEKRAHSVDSNSSSRKNSSESPEPKRPRGGNESKSSSSETPLDLSGRSSRPNSALDNTNSSSPILGSGKPSPSSSSSPSLHPEKSKSTSSSTTTNTGETFHAAHHSSNTNASMSGPPNSKQGSSSTSTSVPKISSPTHHSNANSTANNTRKSASPSLSSSHKSPHHSHHHHHNMSQEGLKKSLPPSNPSSVSAAVSSASILSIAQSLAQKQLQQQQQQNLHNQIMQLHQQHLQHSAQAVVSSAAANQGKVGMKGSSGSSSLGHPSLSPPIIPMPNPSPPGTTFDPLRNLLTLSDAAVRQGKMHPMNNLMAAVGLCPRPPPPPPHGPLTLGGSPGGNTHSLYSHLSPHLVSSLGGGKSPTGILDAGSHAHLFGNLAALSAAHNERIAAAAGINHFGSSLSPPLSLANPFYSGVGVGGVRPPSNSPHGGGSVGGRISGVSPTSNKALSQSSTNCNKKGSTPPLGFSHPPPTSHSPTGISRSSPQPKLPSTSPSPSSSNLPTHSNNSTHSKLTESSSSSGLNSLKNIKINGTVSNPLPLLPPGIHNPLLPIYTRQSQQNSSSSGKSSSTSTTSSSMNKSSSSSSSSSSDKKGIPNSMKISNFLPSKPKDGKAVDANVEATITSGSNVGGSSLTKFLNSIPPLIVSQSQPNLSVSSAPPKDSVRMLNNTFQGKSDKERISIYPASMSNVGGTTTSASSKCVVSHKKLEVAPVSSGSNNGSNKGGGNCPALKSIKNEPTSPTATVSSRINNVGLLPNEKSPTPKVEGTVVAVGLQQTSPIQSKSSSVQIKSEHVEAATVKVTAVESSSTSKLTPSSVGVLSLSSANLISPSSSSSSGRTTQPQNQAVRHIPNPSLLFNRQNNTLVVPSLVSTSSNSHEVSTAVSAKSSPQDVNLHTSPLGMKLDGHTLQVPAIPCPGVSVPVQVKVDNDSIPIPIPVTEVKKETTEPVLPNNACSTAATLGVRDDKTRQLDSSVQEEKHEIKLDGSEQENMPQECQTEVKASETKEEIMKIDYSLEDADVDIDVGTETTPLFPSNDEGNDDLEEEKVSSLATLPKQSEIKEEEEVLGQPEITSQDTSDLIQTKEEVSEVEEKKGDGQNDTEIIKEGSDNEEKPCLNEANLEQEQTQMEIENDDESRRVNMLEKTVEHEEKLADEVETVVTTAAVEMGIPAEPTTTTTTTATATTPTTSTSSTLPTVSVEEDLDVGMEEPMEVQIEPVLLEPLENELEENEKVQQNEEDNRLSHMEIDEVEPQIEIVDEATTSIKDYTTGSDETTLVSHNMIPALDSTSNLVQTDCGESTEREVVSMDHDHESQSTTEQSEVNKEEKSEFHIQSSLGEDEISKIEETTSTVELDIIESEDVEMTECDREDDSVSHENTEANESTVPSGSVIDEKTSAIPTTQPQPELSVPVRSPVSIELKEDKEVVLVVVPQPEKVLEGSENEIPELNGLSNQILITSEALQVTDKVEEMIETLPIQDTSSPVDLKEDAECVTTLAPSEVKLDELMESSSSSSQLETDSSLNVVHGQNASPNEVVVCLDGKLEGCEELEDSKVENNSLDSSPHEKERLNKLEDSNEIPPTICGTDDEVPATSVVLDAPSLLGDEPGSSQNIAVNPEGGDESVSTLNESLEKNTEAVSNVTFQDDDKSLVPSISTSAITFTSDVSGVKEDTVDANQSTQVTEEPTKEETIERFETNEESVVEQTQIVEPGQEDIIKPELISATATITTTTTTTTSVPNSVTSTVEIKLGIPATSIASSTPKAENEGTSIHNIPKIDETFEKVAAGLIASAASTINNNNNTSLSIPTPTCDITITNANA